MPIQRCQIKGKKGWKWGKEGKCYTGPNGRAQATAQGAAIHAGKKEVINKVAESIVPSHKNRDKQIIFKLK